MRRIAALAMLLGTVACGVPAAVTRPLAMETTTSRATTTTRAITTSTMALMFFDSSACTVLQGAGWMASEFGSITTLNENTQASAALMGALVDVGADVDDLYKQQGTLAIANWMWRAVLDIPELYSAGEYRPEALAACLFAPGIEIDADVTEDLGLGLAQVFAGRFGLPGKVLSEDDLAGLDPDGDGFYYIHTGTGDSEDFRLPARFRVTYTGTDSTCAFDIASSITGEDIESIGDLAGGRMRRVTLNFTDDVYITDFIGCEGGEIQFGPEI